MKYFVFTFLLFWSCFSSAQPVQGLVTWLSFDKPGCAIADENGDPAIQIFPNGDLSCGCGVSGSALFFDGNDDWFYLFGEDIESTLTTIDFTLSFYFKPTSKANESMALFNKRLDCTTDNAFSIRFNPLTRVLNVDFIESTVLSGSISKILPQSCWYNVVLMRKGGTTSLYVNNKESGSINSAGSQRVSIKNDELLTVGSGNCNVSVDYTGFMDEIRLYGRALKREEIATLYSSPDMIEVGKVTSGVKDTTIFIGQSVQAQITSSCATEYKWTPAAGVSNTTISNPLLTPSQTTTYALLFVDNFLCLSTDSLRITVVDPTTLDCSDILLPSAFTPNSDGLNDAFGISNPFVVGELLSFEIIDRWGNNVFTTANPLAKWDGTYKGQPVNPGVFLWKLHFRCEEKENYRTGSVTVLR